MCTFITVSVSTQRFPQRVPVLVVEARVAHRGRVLGEGQRVHTLLGDPPHLRGARLGIPDHRNRHRDEPRRVRPAPLLDVPVVVGLHQRHREVVVVGGEQPPRKAREGREADRGQNAAGVHVLDPLVDVVATRPDLVEPRRLDAVLLLGPAGDRVERHVRDDRVAELPHVRAVGVVHQPRRVVHVLLRQVVLEHVRRLDGVVVDADQDHVLFVHGRSLPSVRIRSSRSDARPRAGIGEPPHAPSSLYVENYLLAK